MLDHVALWNTQASDELPAFMNGPVRNALGIIPPEVTWRTCKLSIELSLMFYQMFIRYIDYALVDLGFLEGVTLGTRASEASEH